MNTHLHDAALVLLDEVDFADSFECAPCGSTVIVLDSDAMPSMLGYGSDESYLLACGHTVTFDPFTGSPSFRRR